MTTFIPPAARYRPQPPSRWLTALQLALVLIAFAAAGHVDMREEQRLERERVEQFVNAHHRFMSAADVGDPWFYGRERFPELAVGVCP